MSEAQEIIEGQAIGWVIRLTEPTFADWEPFTLWLEQDVAHAEAYRAVTEADADADVAALLGAGVVPAPRRAPIQSPGGIGRRSFLGWSAAASLLAVAGYAALSRRPSLHSVQTGLGEQRTLALGDGSRVDLNGATRITLDRHDDRFARLDRGEATFTVAHIDGDPFRVETGDASLEVVGTMFNVIREAGATEVAVARGAVLYNPDREAVRLTAGHMLRAADLDGDLVIGAAPPEVIATWRQGRLIYRSAPLASVAADLTRNLGLRVTATSEVAGRPFSGVILLGGDRARLFERLGPLLGVVARRVGRGWLLTTGTRGTV